MITKPSRDCTGNAFLCEDARSRHRGSHARRQIEESISTASSVADTVRSGLENAFEDLRKALLESRSKLA